MSTEITPVAFRAVSAVGDGFRASALPASAPAASAPVPESAAQPDPPQPVDISQALEELVAKAAESGASLDFRIDEDSGRVVVSVVDRRDGTVLRQMPSEEALRIARNLARCEPHLIEMRA
jgi:flagellar protein FlaG